MADTESARANTAFQDWMSRDPTALTESPERQRAMWVGWWGCWQARDPGAAGRVLGEIRELLGIGIGVSVTDAIKALLPEPDHGGIVPDPLADSRAMNADLRAEVAKLEGMLAVHREHAAGAVP